ncbi:MAG: hypothetical protein Q8Q02_12595 [Nocardioides sp.]|nr:hypothetical protein [Nocardioides sp.]
MSTYEGLPYEHGSILAEVAVANRDGIVSDGFGEVRVRAGEGKSVLIEVTDDLTGYTMVATLDAYRPIRARVNLRSTALCEAVYSAARENGTPTPFPTPQ